jgi:hypothetical protein
MSFTKAERTEQATEAALIAEEFADEPLLPASELRKMDLDEIDAYFKARGVDIDWESHELDIRNALGSYVLQLDRGEELTDEQERQLDERCRRAVIQSARDIANKTMGDIRFTAMDEADDRPEDEKNYMWGSVGSGCCEDCRELHGTVFQRDYWQGIEPRDGKTACLKKCRCSLLPCGGKAENEGLRNEEAR